MLISVKLLFSVIKINGPLAGVVIHMNFMYKITACALCCFYFLIKANFMDKLLKNLVKTRRYTKFQVPLGLIIRISVSLGAAQQKPVSTRAKSCLSCGANVGKRANER